MATATRGFASMAPARRREVGRRGGRAAHRTRKAHEWTREEAQAASRKRWIKFRRRSWGTGDRPSVPPPHEALGEA